MSVQEGAASVPGPAGRVAAGEVPMGQEEVVVRTFKDHHLDLLRRLQLGHERIEIAQRLRIDLVDRRMVEGDPPERR